MSGLGVGLVGCGRWGRHILRELLAADVGVVVVDPSAESRLAATGAGAMAVAELEELPDLDGLVVATPASTHARVVERLLESQPTPIFVEKPFTTGGLSAESLDRRADGRVFVMHKWRYHPGVERLRDLGRSGALGPTQSLWTRRLGSGPAHDDVDCIWTLAPHDLSIALEVLGHVPTPFEATAQLEAGQPFALQAKLGASPRMSLELSSRGLERVREVRLVGAEGMAELTSPDAPSVRVLAPDGRLVREEALPADPPLRRELSAFLDHLRGGPAPRSSSAEGLEEVRTIEALRRLAGLAD
jgi:predicted dehydrogenase